MLIEASSLPCWLAGGWELRAKARGGTKEERRGTCEFEGFANVHEIHTHRERHSERERDGPAFLPFD